VSAIVNKVLKKPEVLSEMQEQRDARLQRRKAVRDAVNSILGNNGHIFTAKQVVDAVS